MGQNAWLQMLVVGLGVFVGSAARFAVGGLVHRLPYTSTFPCGTLAVNLIGCFSIGLLGGWMEVRQLLGPGQRLFLIIGVLGGFTTFSSFAYETLGLAHGAELAKAAFNAVVHVVLGLGLAWLGYSLAERI